MANSGHFLWFKAISRTYTFPFFPKFSLEKHKKFMLPHIYLNTHTNTSTQNQTQVIWSTKQFFSFCCFIGISTLNSDKMCILFPFYILNKRRFCAQVNHIKKKHEFIKYVYRKREDKFPQIIMANVNCPRQFHYFLLFKIHFYIIIMVERTTNKWCKRKKNEGSKW